MTVDGACCQKNSLIKLLMSMIIYLKEFFYQGVFPRCRLKHHAGLFF